MVAWLFCFFFFLTYNGLFETFAEVDDVFLHVIVLVIFTHTKLRCHVQCLSNLSFKGQLHESM